MIKEIESEINYTQPIDKDLLEKQIDRLNNTILVSGAKIKMNSVKRTKIQYIRAKILLNC